MPEFHQIRLLAAPEIVMGNGRMSMVKRMVIEVGRRDEEPRERPRLDVPQSFFRQRVVAPGDVLDKRSKIREETGERRELEHP